MMVADDFRLRVDPGPEFSWAARLWWQHTQSEVHDSDLLELRSMVHTIHDAVAMQNP